MLIVFERVMLKLVDAVVWNWEIVWGFRDVGGGTGAFGAILPSQLNELFSKSGSLRGEMVRHRADGVQVMWT